MELHRPDPNPLNHPTYTKSVRPAALAALIFVLPVLALLLLAPAPAQAAQTVMANMQADSELDEPEMDAIQEDVEGNPGDVEEIVQLEHTAAREMAKVLSIFPLRVQSHEDLGLVTLRGAPADVAAAVAAARRLDVPRKPSPPVQILVHVLRTSRSADGPTDVPDALADVALQLRNVFGLQSIALVDTILVRSADRAAGQVSGILANGGDPVDYRFGFNRLGLTAPSGGEGQYQVRLEGLLFTATTTSEPVRMVTDLEVREGQKAVVGKASTGHQADESLVVVVEVDVLD